MQKSLCQVEGEGGIQASGRGGLCLFQEQEGVGVRGAWGSGAVTDLFGEDAQVLCGARESVWRCTAAAVEAWMTRVAGSGEAWMDPRSVLGVEWTESAHESDTGLREDRNQG